LLFVNREICFLTTIEVFVQSNAAAFGYEGCPLFCGDGSGTERGGHQANRARQPRPAGRPYDMRGIGRRGKAAKSAFGAGAAGGKVAVELFTFEWKSCSPKERKVFSRNEKAPYLMGKTQK